jgi:subtilase family serine protease
MTLLTVPTAAQQKALTQLLAEQQDRNSPNYHKWLTPEQWADRFGLSRNDIRQITDWLQAQGFSNVHAARGRNWVSFTGSAAQVESALGTEIHHFNVHGELHYANVRPPSLPEAVAGIVTGVSGLHDFHPRPLGIRKNSFPRPFYNSSSFGPLVAPGDIATIYDINALYSAGIDGTGQKLAVMGQTDFYLADLNDFRNGFGLTTISTTNCKTDANGLVSSANACNDPLLKYVSGGTDPGVKLSTGDLMEADLDLEWAGAVARNAQIIYVNSTDTFTSFQYAIDNNVAPVISLSYGLCEFDDNQLPSHESLLKMANSEGITFVNSSGDTGAAECDYGGNGGTLTSTNLATQGLAVSYPASSPEVTSVGGSATPLADFTATYWGTTNGPDGGTALSYIPEQAWNDDYEFMQYCQSNSSSTFCTQGGSSPQPGWVKITSEATAQQDIGPSSTGGGPSNCAKQNANFSACVSGFAMPAWQTVTVSGQGNVRLSPDLSFFASPNFPGYIFCTPLDQLGHTGTTSSCANGIATAVDQYVSIIGGTSASTPVFAGMVTLLNQYLSASGLGNVNPTLYSLAQTPSNGAFNPITTGDNNVYCQPNTPSNQPVALQCPASGVIGFDASNGDAVTGFNLVTGLGSVNLQHLALAWSASTGGFTLAPTAASFQVAQGSSIDATVKLTFGGSFSGTVTFTCTDPATASVCTVPPPTNAAGQVSFHITTAPPTAQLLSPLDRGTGILYAMLLPGIMGLVLTGSRKHSLRAMRFLGFIVVLGISTVWLASCGGGSSTNGNPGTPKGTYTITVKGTSGSTTSSATFNLIVQ